jgi:Predicted Zn-dependent proteases and their inactivated homologs
MPAHPNPHFDELAELALKCVVASGAEYGDIRLLDSRTQTIRGEDRRIASIRDTQDRGFGIRVLYHGAWGLPPVRAFDWKKPRVWLNWRSNRERFRIPCE